MGGGTELDRSVLPQAEVTFSLPVASPSLGGAGAAGNSHPSNSEGLRLLNLRQGVVAFKGVRDHLGQRLPQCAGQILHACQRGLVFAKFEFGDVGPIDLRPVGQLLLR